MQVIHIPHLCSLKLIVKTILSPNRFSLLIICLCLCISTSVFSKDPARIVTAGIQFKPIFPVSFLHTGTQSAFDQSIRYDLTLKSGFSGGMVIRKGFSELLSIETGINYVKRKYRLDVLDGN